MKKIILFLMVILSVAIFGQGEIKRAQIGKAYLSANGVTTGAEKIIAHPYLPNNFFIRDRYGNYNAMVFIPQFNWTPQKGFDALGRASEVFGTITDQDTLVLNAACSASDDEYNGCYLVYNSEWRVIKDWIGATKKAVIDSFTVRPTVANTYVMYAIHPAFIVNGTIIKGFYVGKYEASIISGTGVIQNYETQYSGTSWDTGAEWITANKCAHSKVNLAPQVNVDYDAAKAACEAMNLATDAVNTTGLFHLISNAEWSAIALWCRHQVITLSQTWVRGNNYYGQDVDDRSINFTQAANDAGIRGVSSNWRALGGSGGIKTSHDKTEAGVYDLNGNVWEWTSGFRVNEGKIYVAGNTATSAITGGNSFEATEVNYYDTGIYYNWDGVSGTFTWSSANRGTTLEGASPDYKGQGFNDNSTGANDLLKKLCIAPVNVSGDYGSDYYYMRNFGERFPLRGASWARSSHAGLFCSYLYFARSVVDGAVGFRCAFVKI